MEGRALEPHLVGGVLRMAATATGSSAAAASVASSAVSTTASAAAVVSCCQQQRVIIAIGEIVAALVGAASCGKSCCALPVTR